MPPQTVTYKNPYSCLDIEDIELNTFYSISINPEDTNQYFGEKDWKQRLLKFTTNLGIQLNRILQPCKYELYLEVSPQSRLHWHGLIKFKHIEDIKRFYLTQIPKLKNLATYEIDKINDKDKWQQYYTKQFNLWDTKITSEDKISKLALIDIESEVTYKKIPLQ